MDLVTEVKRAIKLTQEKDYKSAEAIYIKLLQLNKDNSTILSLLGLLYLNTGNFKRAHRILIKSDKLKPNNPTTIEALGFVLYKMGQYSDACKYFEQIIDTTKNNEVYEKFANSLIELKMFSKAYNIVMRMYEKSPLSKDILSVLIHCCIYTGRFNEAVKHAQKLLTMFPKEPETWLRQGLIQEVIFHDEPSAQKCYKMALKYGDKAAAYHNLAISYGKTKEYAKAEKYIKKVIKMDGLNASNCFICSVMNFYQRKYKQGYKWYVLKDLFKTNDPIIRRMRNPWDGKRYKGKSLHIHCDQGFGDVVMFSRYFPFLEKKFDKIIICTYPSLLKIFRRSFKQYKNIKFVKHSYTLPRTDKSAIMSSLPHYLKMQDKFPLSEGYLLADDKRVKELKEKYFNTDKLKVGICWEAGAAGIREQLNRTLSIDVFDELLKMENVQFYSMQYKPTLDDYKNYSNIMDIGPSFRDFDDTAAALKNLDVLVTVDTSVAHLAGALGVKTFMLLPYCPDWRWFDNDSTTEWYDSIKIFKQTDNIFWDKEISGIKAELENF